MPLARIDLRKGKSADYLQRVGETIYQASDLRVGLSKDKDA